MIEAVGESISPAPVFIHGGDNRTARLLVRAAETREDVEIQQVTLSFNDRVDPEQFVYLASHDSVYGNQELAFSPDQVKMFDPDTQWNLPSATPLVATTVGDNLYRFGLLPEPEIFGRETPDCGGVVYTEAQPYNTTRQQPIAAFPVFEDSFGEHYNKNNPLYVPSAIMQLALPLLQSLHKEAGLVQASVVELANYTNGQAITDQARPNIAAYESRAATLGSIETENDLRWVRFYDSPTNRIRFNRMLDSLSVRTISIPVAVGSRAVFHVNLQDRFDSDEVLDAALADEINRIDLVREQLSSRDVVGTDRGVISEKSISNHGQTLSFSLTYDSDWLRVQRILDVAQVVHKNRSNNPLAPPSNPVPLDSL